MQRDSTKKDLIAFLENHIDRVASVRNHILREYYEGNSDERDSFKSMVDEYAEYIRHLIKEGSEVLEKEKWPLVLIGSTVKAHNLKYDEIDKLTIVPPFYGDSKKGVDCASCLSPIGRALLLKRIGDEVRVSTPLGNFNLVIKSIKTPNI